MLMSFLLSTAEKFLNQFLHLDPETPNRLAALNNKIVAIKSPSIKQTVYFQFTQTKIKLLAYYDGMVDVVLEGTPFDFLRLNFAGSTSSALFASDITMSGDIDAAEKFKLLFARLDIDWEEQLSRITGDIVAHQVGNFVRALCIWARQATDTVQQDITEYLQEEANLLPTRIELEDFFAEVDTLRNDVERLAMKMERLLHS